MSGIIARLRHLLPALLLAGSVPAWAEIIHIDNAELARLQAQGVTVVDIRTAPEWQQTGIIPGSRMLTFFDERGRADPPAWLAQLKRVVTVEQPVILICRSGNRTRAVADFLAGQAGYRTVYNVRDGIRAWSREGRHLTPAAPALAKCTAEQIC